MEGPGRGSLFLAGQTLREMAAAVVINHYSSLFVPWGLPARTYPQHCHQASLPHCPQLSHSRIKMHKTVLS